MVMLSLIGWYFTKTFLKKKINIKITPLKLKKIYRYTFLVPVKFLWGHKPLSFVQIDHKRADELSSSRSSSCWQELQLLIGAPAADQSFSCTLRSQLWKAKIRDLWVCRALIWKPYPGAGLSDHYSYSHSKLHLFLWIGLSFNDPPPVIGHVRKNVLFHSGIPNVRTPWNLQTNKQTNILLIPFLPHCR